MAIWMNPERVWKKVVSKKGECWIWKGRKQNNGYGVIDAGNSSILAHRAAYFLSNGYIAPDDCIMHICDNPICCNPEHLKAGSHADNMRDMKEKSRRKGINCGEKNGRAKLNQSVANEIRYHYIGGSLLKDLAKKYGVGISTVHRIIKRKNWNG